MLDRDKCTVSDEALENRAKSIISQMSLKEKVFALSGNWQMIRDIVVYKRTYNPVPIESHGDKRLGLDPIAFTDGPRGVIMGHSTCFPVSMARAASFDRELEQQIGDAIGQEARAQGANYFGGVCVNLLMHPAGGRAQEGYGEDPYLTGEMGSQLVRGVQKNNVMACAKHFALNNMENRRFHVSVDCSERTLREVYLPQFKKCVDAGCASLMGSYNRFRGEQASESKHLLTDILRNDWGFEGFTITDFIFALRSGAKAIMAGMDVEMPFPVHFGLELKRDVEKGILEEKYLDRALMRMIKTVLAFENTPDPMRYDKSLICNQNHINLARKAAEEGMVLIKNDGVLPFDRSVKRVLVVGHLASEPNTGDHGSSSVYPPYVVTALDGIRRYLGDDSEVVQVNEKDLDIARELAPKYDAVIYVLGNDYNDEGEYVVPDESINPIEYMAAGFKNNGHPLMGAMMRKAAGKSDQAMSSYTSSDEGVVGGDRKSLHLRPAEIKAIEELKGLNPNTVVTLVCGSMIMTREWEEDVPAILYSFYSGMEGGNALAAILWGDVNPSGKLPFTIPTDEKHLPKVDFENADEIYYDYYHGYRKLDHEGNAADHPFGFGLSYTTFAYGEPTAALTEDGVDVTFTVKNTGKRYGTEVAELYVAVPESTVERHVRELKGFKRVPLAPGEEKSVTIHVPFDELKYYDEATGQWVLEQTKYAFEGGPCDDAAKLKTAEIAIG